ncbi:MAG: 3-oxo-5-alpha-steroid 4-dehydrogenase-domain-containing protein [Piptocephalis tieghemiana]|nr:MAG: 3-oxo-5-alpha-steroid 4-dehydrogenase-domain-containing protein [Piptocephalis tieghemiana]
MSVHLTVVRRQKPGKSSAPASSGPFPLGIELSGSEESLNVDDILRAVHQKLPKYYPERQRLSRDNKALQPGQTLASQGVQNGDTLEFKDLGPQIGWRTVFLIEYFGPLLIHPLMYYFAPLIYNSPHLTHGRVQHTALAMILFHFLKRELETLFVHRFSHGTMPLINIFKNCAHYHILSGLLLAYFTYGPSLAANSHLEASLSPTAYWTCVIAFVMAEFANLQTHITLKNLRPPGTRVRRIPYGFGFNLVSCPNYLFETLAWIAYSSMVRTWPAWFFTGVAFGQMYLWAMKKHQAYRKEFSDYPRNRKPMIPLIG